MIDPNEHESVKGVSAVKSSEEKSTVYLALRALVVTVLVLILLTILRKLGLIVSESDVPTAVVEEVLSSSAGQLREKPCKMRFLKNPLGSGVACDPASCGKLGPVRR
jgi:hypothetical protein